MFALCCVETVPVPAAAEKHKYYVCVLQIALDLTCDGLGDVQGACTASHFIRP